MDSQQQAANRAQIKGYPLSIIAIIINVILAVAPYIVSWLNGSGGAIMLKGLLPTILLLCSTAVSASTSIILVFRLLKTKRLTKERDSLQSDLSEEKTNSQRLKNELDAKTSSTAAIGAKLTETEKNLQEETKRANFEANQRDNWMNSCREAEHKWSDVRWFDELLIAPQSKQIQNYVPILQVILKHLQVDCAPRLVRINIRIRNDSVFRITIDPKAISGSLYYKAEPLTEQIRFSSDIQAAPIKDMEPRTTALIVLEQPLLAFEAENIREAQQTADVNAIFSLAYIHIPISVENIPQTVETQDLRITSGFDLLYLSDFNGLLFEEENMTPKELLNAVDLLPVFERMEIYRATLGAYKNALLRRHETDMKLREEGFENPESLARPHIKSNTNNP